MSRHPEISVEPLISMSEQKYEKLLRDAEERSGWDLVDLLSFYCFRLPQPDDDPHGLLADILRAPEVEIAYYDPIPVQTTCQDLGSPTPDFTANQTYHDPAPLGTDLDYAKASYGADVTDGASSSTWCAVLETWSAGATGIGYDLGHEEWSSPVNATPEGTPDNTKSHAAGVGGVLAACDDNNVGVVGYLADETVRFYDIVAIGTVSTYVRVLDELIAGEICNGSFGYYADPMPDGQECPCNPGQNGQVPPEYAPAVKAAIQNCVADGIHCFTGAANGCVNLDDPVFGTTFRNSTDSGSNIVGAIQAALPHDASCYTGYGERVDLNAYGNGVYSCGYGSAFSGTGSAEWYASGFNGTSSASPIVGGCAGVVNNVYRHLNSGANVPPLTMRTYLTAYGTPPNSQPGNIGVMPNLRGILAPELNSAIPTGWYSYVVPRTTSDGTFSSMPLPANLLPAPSTTYWNTAYENTASIGTATECFNESISGRRSSILSVLTTILRARGNSSEM